jgi:hypothetical protein
VDRALDLDDLKDDVGAAAGDRDGREVGRGVEKVARMADTLVLRRKIKDRINNE